MGEGPSGGWRFWIDRGGTFTDVVALDSEGRLHVRKLLSVLPGRYDDAALEAVRSFLGLEPQEAIPVQSVRSLSIGTTIATNALLERKGERTLLVVTKGFADQLEIGTQERPDIFARRVIKWDMLYERVIEADERILADGTIERPLDQEGLRSRLETARRDGILSVAILLMNSYAYPEHEQRAAAIAGALGFEDVVASHEIVPLMRIVPRGDTTVADAYLTPALRRYVHGVGAAIDGAAKADAGPRLLRFMTSSGGLVSAERFRGKDALLSGPAGGVVGMAESAREAGFPRVIGFDMGGTSTDVSHFSGSYERSYERRIAGARIAAPMLSIHTVAAGGGSILTFDGLRMRVGPESAGSSPGPMCYRRGGPLTVTDANVMLGKIRPETFPALFGSEGCEPIDAASVTVAFTELARRIGGDRSPEDIADGYIRIAVECMADAIRTVSVARGHDVTDYALQAFGSAAGQHACLIADTLGIGAVLVHPLSGLLSAYGIGLAGLRASREVSLEVPLEAQSMSAIEARAASLAQSAAAELTQSGAAGSDITTEAWVHVRYQGTDMALPVRLGDVDEMCGDFERQHLARFGFTTPRRALVAGMLEVVATEARDHRELASAVSARQSAQPERSSTRACGAFFSGGRWHDAPIIERDALPGGRALSGPALVVEPHQTVVVEPGWSVALQPGGMMILSRSVHRKGHRDHLDGVDPVLLEVLGNRFMAIAEEMGEALRASAQSVNIKERLDFSCAVFDGGGALVANAPHVPVHLGSMDRSVESVIKAFSGAMRPGDSFMINAPYSGGTHLPDITVVTPVFGDEGERAGRNGVETESTAKGRPLFYVASRGHHADIGGLTPGSMSPSARSIDEEGVLIEPTRLVALSQFLESETRALLTSGRYPARNPEANLADLKAQVAANARGVAALLGAADSFGLEAVRAYMGHVQDNAEAIVRRLVSRLSDGHARIETDDGTVVVVEVKIDRERQRARIDFTGTSPQFPGNLNAPEPVTRAAVLYVVRVLVDEPIPMNAGCLRPLDIVIPEGSLLSPRYPAAVVAGNTETSQVVANALFSALGALAPSQGTMNNLTFGNARHQYYETICSGSCAGPGFDGVPAVQVHMTNTRLTDPEVLELRYPVVVEAHSIRRGSGGRGQWCAGDGTRRVLRFLEPMHVSILSGYRRLAPPGLMEGESGEKGRNLIRRASGDEVGLGGSSEIAVDAGDVLQIDTPTGGGFGPLARRGR